MGDENGGRTVAWARRIAPVTALAVIVFGASVLAGWLFDIQALKSVLPGLATMKANTALCFVLSGLSLWCTQQRSPGPRMRLSSLVCASAVVLVALLTLGEHLFHGDLGIDQLLFRPAPAVAGFGSPGRMAPATALSFLLCGMALLLLDARVLLAQLLSLLATLLGLLALLGYAYGGSALYHITAFSSIAVHTAVGLVLLGAGLLCSRPDRALVGEITNQHLGGSIARRFLPVFLLVLPVFGWLRVQGERIAHFGTEFGVAYVITATILFLMIVTWYNARALNSLDISLHHIADNQRDILAALPASVALLNNQGDILAVNEAWVRFGAENGYSNPRSGEGLNFSFR